MYIKPNRVNDAKHLQNLYSHMDRSSHKYDSIRQHVYVDVIKPLQEPYNDMMRHYVMEYDSVQKAKLVANYIIRNMEKPCYAMTIVGGSQPNGQMIVPCIHIIFNGAYVKSLASLLKDVHF